METFKCQGISLNFVSSGKLVASMQRIKLHTSMSLQTITVRLMESGRKMRIGTVSHALESVLNTLEMQVRAIWFT